MFDIQTIYTTVLHFALLVARFARFEATRYLIVVALFSALWLWWRRHPHQRSKLQAHGSAPGQTRREIVYTIYSLLIFGAIVPVLWACGLGPYMRIYRDAGAHGWPYFAFTLVLMMLIQDTYFYWTHRLMHQRRLFRFFHRTHHLSTNPTPWTTYAINPLEAVVNSGASLIVLFLFPVSALALFIFGIVNTAYAVYGHLGYEIFPAGLAQHWLGRWINTSVAHNTHHARARYNYGWYFLFWDRLMGTLDPHYQRSYASAKSAPPG